MPDKLNIRIVSFNCASSNKIQFDTFFKKIFTEGEKEETEKLDIIAVGFQELSVRLLMNIKSSINNSIDDHTWEYNDIKSFLNFQAGAGAFIQKLCIFIKKDKGVDIQINKSEYPTFLKNTKGAIIHDCTVTKTLTNII